MEMNYPQPYNPYFQDYDKGDPNGFQGMMPMKYGNIFLDEWSYTIEKKKMNAIAENVDRYFSEIPEVMNFPLALGKYLRL